MRLTIVVGATIVAFLPRAEAQTQLPCSYYQEQARAARENVSRCEYGLSAAQKQHCKQTFQQAAENYDAEYRTCLARRKPAAPSGGGYGGAGFAGMPNGTAEAAAGALANALGKLFDDHAAADAAAQEAADLRRQLEEEQEERERLARQLEDLQRQQRLQALKAELETIYTRRGVWSPDNDPKVECNEMAWLMMPKTCEAVGQPRPESTAPDPADAPPTVAEHGCADGTDFVTFSCRTSVPGGHHGCRTVTPNPFEHGASGDDCSYQWGCCLTPADRDLVVGKRAPVDTCTYDEWGPSRIAGIAASAPAADLWTYEQCVAFAEEVQVFSRRVMPMHDADAAARREAESTQSTLPAHHCCTAEGHVEPLVDFARALHAQQRQERGLVALGGQCTAPLQQADLNLSNLISLLEWELGAISEDPKVGGPLSGAYRTWSTAVTDWELGMSDFRTLCSALAARTECVAKVEAPKHRRHRPRR